MNRSPLFYPLNRGGDADAGGAADLQTDVMRFMAILSLCLVAIFALVQTLPPEAPTPPKETRPPAQIEEPKTQLVEALPDIQPEPVAEEPQVANAEVLDANEIDLRYPAIPEYTPPPAPEPVQQSVEEVVKASPVEPSPINEEADEPTVADESVAEPEEGFSLRFEDGLALTRLVARNEVGMYAMTADKAMRMNINRGDIGFWTASTPKQFHEMESSTVPAPVIDAFRHSDNAASVKWGVTLPPGMTQQLNQFLRQNSGGAIVIEADGQMRLEQ
jgi:hypothetical protein